MNPAPRRPLGAARQIGLVVVAVAVFVPLGLAAWIGLIFLAEHLEVDLTANEVFSWMLAAAVALLLWPVTLAAMRRLFWAQRSRKPGDPDPARNAKNPPVPTAEVAVGDRIARILVIIIGAVALFVICGSQEITALLTYGLGSASGGSRSAWLLLQLLVFVLLFALFFPVLWATDRMLRKTPPGDPRRPHLEIRQDWYLAAVTAWVGCLVLGYLFSYLVLTRL